MSLTPTQKATLHSDMISRPELATMIANGDDIGLAEFYNTPVTPSFVVWKTIVTQEEYQSEQSPSSTYFNWSGTGGYIARSQGERDAWRVMFVSGSVNPSKPNVITAFNDIFSGTGAGAVNNRSHLLAMSKRNANLIEKLLAVGTGTDASPATITFEGNLSYIDASEAR